MGKIIGDKRTLLFSERITEKRKTNNKQKRGCEVKKLVAIVAIVAGLLFCAAQAAMAQTTLSGWFVTIWPDAPSGEQPPRYFLIGKDGLWTELEIGEAVKGLRSFDRKQVTVEGSYEEPLAAADVGTPQTTRSVGQKFRVRSILPDKESSLAPMATEMAAQAAVLGSKPWATILCRFADSTGVTPRERGWFDELMLGDNYPSMNHYWSELSYDQIDLAGSQVAGWYNLPHPRSHYIYDTNGDGQEDTDLGQLAIDCAAVADAEVYFPVFYGINFVFQDTGCCAWGGSWALSLDGQQKMYGTTWATAHTSVGQSLWAHEMGHGFGLPHSSGPYNAVYDSAWDVMSAQWWGCTVSPHPVFHCVGQHTISYHKDLLGWIPTGRQYTAAPGSSVTIEVERLAQPAGVGYLMAKIPINGSTTEFYTVETRQRVGYDNQLPGDAVLIHHVDTVNRWDRQAQVVDVDNNGNPNDAAAMWTPGETFIGVNGISVAVGSATANGFLVTITNGNAPPIPPPLKFTLTVGKNGNGIVTAPGIYCGSDCLEQFTDGTVVALSAYPDAGWTFAGWSGDADCADWQVMMSRDIACTAVFTRIPAPDLVGYFVSLSNKVKKGRGKVSFSVSVANVGDQSVWTADKRINIAVYLSSDAVWDGSDQYLTTVSAKAKKGLAPWKSVAAKGKVTLQEPGSGKFFIAVIDPWNQVAESDEANNAAVAPIP